VAVELTDKDKAEPRTLSYGEAMVSPCATCDTSPCCSFLPLTTFQAQSLSDLDNAAYMLNFDRIELGLSIDGQWHVYFRQPCRFLSPDDCSCTIHGTAGQPSVCVHYDPYTCWYRPALSGPGNGSYHRIDARRFQVILGGVRFDDHRRVVAVPTWDALTEAFAALPIEVGADRFLPEPRPAAPPRPLPLAGLSFDDPLVVSPCEGCAAFCCTTLAFPMPTPASAAGLDYVRFVLGFPDVTVAVEDEQWSVVVATTCRHLDGNRCGVFGLDERPLRCRTYNEWTCSYKRNLGANPPGSFARIDLARFGALAGIYQFDANGDALHLPPGAEIAAHLRAVQNA